jgi:lysophospholipase L1-like esterase
VLAESPHASGDMDVVLAPWRASYQQTVQGVATAHGIAYADFNTTLALSPAAFTDMIHLSRAGRATWSARFVDELAGWRRPAG